MEPPSAAVSHWKFHWLRCFSYSFVFRNVHHRAKKREESTYRRRMSSRYLQAGRKEANRPCADYEAISVYHLLSLVDEIFIQIFHVFSPPPWQQCFPSANCRLQERRKSICIQRRKSSSSSGNSIQHKILPISCETCIILSRFFIAQSVLSQLLLKFPTKLRILQLWP